MQIFPPYWAKSWLAQKESIVATNRNNITQQHGGSLDGTVQRPTSKTNVPAVITYKKQDLQEFLRQVATKYGQDYSTMARVIECESGWKTDIYSTGKVSYGIAQFTRPTWVDYGIGKYANPYDQLKTMAYMWSKGLKTRWDCYNNLFKNSP